VLCVPVARKLTNMNFDILCKMASYVFNRKVFYMKIYLHKKLRPTTFTGPGDHNAKRELN
jgi:hypothetical protein